MKPLPSARYAAFLRNSSCSISAAVLSKVRVHSFCRRLHLAQRITAPASTPLIPNQPHVPLGEEAEVVRKGLDEAFGISKIRVGVRTKGTGTRGGGCVSRM